MAIELSDELINLEQQAWAEIQAGTLTVETASAAQAGITAFAESAGENRYDVRHPEPPVAD